ncbi:hypothetical protein PR048_015438 [Dryococelus australis]|uniref:Uncharacterized protein n=1 Tax=Dryococelus australis TaxID=614101 RepID=A0ABQ9HH20_9NEOP|nr:hypothetical protein PR048_015438 [Dryococelus australis]
MMVVEELMERDWGNRTTCCELIFANVPAHAVARNFDYWAGIDPRQLHEGPLHTPLVTVWCAIGRVTAARYVHILRAFLEPYLAQVAIPDVWFQPKMALPLTHNEGLNGGFERIFPRW